LYFFKVIKVRNDEKGEGEVAAGKRITLVGATKSPYDSLKQLKGYPFKMRETGC
jgi:hypothetical protein